MLGILEYVISMLRILANERDDEEARWSDGEILRCASLKGLGGCMPPSQDDRREA